MDLKLIADAATIVGSLSIFLTLIFVGYELKEMGFQTNLHDMSSPWVGLNFLSISTDTVVVESRQTNLIKMFEKNK